VWEKGDRRLTPWQAVLRDRNGGAAGGRVRWRGGARSRPPCGPAENAVSAVMDGLLAVPPLLAYLLIGLLVFGEAAIFVGFVLPGETAVVLGGVLASRQQIDIVALCFLVVIAAIIGDSVGFELGRRFGDRLLGWGPLARHERRLNGARTFLRERGAFAVFLGRWTAFLRAVMPGLAGVSRMSYRRFLVYNALGGLAWGLTFCLVGYLAGESYQAVERRVGTIGAVVTALAAVAALVVWHRRRHAA
jgi:membrane-associated protein